MTQLELAVGPAKVRLVNRADDRRHDAPLRQPCQAGPDVCRYSARWAFRLDDGETGSLGLQDARERRRAARRARGAPVSLFRSGRVALISCGAEKLAAAAPARDLYTGPLFRSARRWVELRDYVYPAWGILSARHGLLLPNQVVEPYDASLAAMSEPERAAWGTSAAEKIRRQWGTEVIYTVLAGEQYMRALSGFPYVEDVYAHWHAAKREVTPGVRWGIGHLLSILSMENERSEWWLAQGDDPQPQPAEAAAKRTRYWTRRLAAGDREAA